MSQEKLQTIVMQNFWGLKRCIMGFVQVENRDNIVFMSRNYRSDSCPLEI